jgi:hypothetical protein
MDSEDDTRDSADEDFYSGGEAGLALSDDGDADYDFADHDSDDSDDLISHRQQVIIDLCPPRARSVYALQVAAYSRYSKWEIR